MIGDSASLTEVGGTAAIVAAALSALVSFYATRVGSKAKKGELREANTRVAQDVIMESMDFSRKDARELRGDLTNCRDSNEQLQADLANERAAHAETRRQLRALKEGPR